MDESDARLEFKRLQALQETGLLTSHTPREFDEICRRAKEHFRMAMALVTLIKKDVQIVKGRAGTDLQETPRSVAFCDYTIRTDDVFVVPDATEDPRFASNPLVTGEPFIRFYAGAPLIYQREIRLGALCLLDTKPGKFTLGDKAELIQMADEIVGIILRQEFDGKFATVGL